MALLPPGVRFLARKLLVPSLFFLIIQGTASHPIYGLGLPYWAASLIAVFTAFTVVVAKSILTTRYHARAAHALGARLPSVAAGSKLGSVDLLSKMVAASENGYIGEQILPSRNSHIHLVLQVRSHRLLVSGVFNSDGEIWSFHRYFSRDRFQHFDIFDHHTDRVISLIKSRMAEGHAVDFQDLISRLTMDSATHFLFGSSVDSPACGPPYPHNATATFPVSQDSLRAQENSQFV
ncbi:hypothetical protein C8F01DRAFT_1300170 [Mycena amicta]|nr:hypothetical protein C8F01DRAFT_1300170 [Mycena amicta]